jgi:hypothetical protein
LEVVADGYETYSDTIAINSEQETAVRVTLMSASPEGLDPLWFWVGVGTTSALAVGTIITGAEAAVYNGDADDYLGQMRTQTASGISMCGADPAANAACWSPYNARIDRLKALHGDANDTADSLEIATWVLLGLTAAAAGGTVYLFLESAPLFGGSEAEISFAPIVTDSSVGFGAWGTF